MNDVKKIVLLLLYRNKLNVLCEEYNNTCSIVADYRFNIYKNIYDDKYEYVAYKIRLKTKYFNYRFLMHVYQYMDIFNINYEPVALLPKNY